MPALSTGSCQCSAGMLRRRRLLKPLDFCALPVGTGTTDADEVRAAFEPPLAPTWASATSPLPGSISKLTRWQLVLLAVRLCLLDSHRSILLGLCKQRSTGGARVRCCSCTQLLSGADARATAKRTACTCTQRETKLETKLESWLLLMRLPPGRPSRQRLTRLLTLKIGCVLGSPCVFFLT